MKPALSNRNSNISPDVSELIKQSNDLIGQLIKKGNLKIPSKTPEADNLMRETLANQRKDDLLTWLRQQLSSGTIN